MYGAFHPASFLFLVFYVIVWPALFFLFCIFYMTFFIFSIFYVVSFIWHPLFFTIFWIYSKNTRPLAIILLNILPILLIVFYVWQNTWKYLAHAWIFTSQTAAALLSRRTGMLSSWRRSQHFRACLKNAFRKMFFTVCGESILRKWFFLHVWL